ncbi:MAG TPA: TolC family protein [Steroidobacteraceae bacterium]|nr:TolC family protein [Steroidobacteraceae bacterium]
MRHAFLLLITFAALGVSACAGFSRDGGFDAVADTSRRHLALDPRWPRTPEEKDKVAAQVAGLLRHPLSAADAVQVALLNNRMLQADFEELGISEADLVQAGRLPNPRFDLRHASAGGQYDIEETLSLNVLALLTMPYVRDIEKRRFAQAQDAVVLRIAQLAQDTREAFYRAVAARESRDYQLKVRAAAETGATLARRMVAAGNWNKLDAAREQSFYADAVQGLTQAQLAEQSARERLLVLLGLPGDKPGGPELQLGGSLPELPGSAEQLPDVEQAVLQNRLDLQLMRAQIDELQQRLKLTRSTRFVNVLDLGATRVRQGARDTPYERGYTVTLEVPIFDSGAARLKKSEATYAQAVDRFAHAAIEARSQIRLAYAGYRAAYELAVQQRDEVLPLRKAITQENLLRYNASQVSIFELLSDAREQAAGIDGYIQRQRDFWIAKSRLDGALLGNSTP